MKYIIVGINNTQHIIDNCFECISFECQYDIIINGIWKGNLYKAWFLDILSVFLAVSERYKYMFAGKTAINSNIIPHAANFLVLLNNNNIPNIISINPLTRTTSSLQFIIEGTILTKKSVFVKCLIPTITYNRLII